MGRDASASEERSHLLPVNALASPLPPIGIDVHQEALRSVGCRVKDWGCEVVGKSSTTGHLKKKRKEVKLMVFDQPWNAPSHRQVAETCSKENKHAASFGDKAALENTEWFVYGILDGSHRHQQAHTHNKWMGIRWRVPVSAKAYRAQSFLAIRQDFH